MTDKQNEEREAHEAHEERYEGGCYEGIPCTCPLGCAYNCKGGCGCRACSACYGDFLAEDRS